MPASSSGPLKKGYLDPHTIRVRIRVPSLLGSLSFTCHDSRFSIGAFLIFMTYGSIVIFDEEFEGFIEDK